MMYDPPPGLSNNFGFHDEQEMIRAAVEHRFESCVTNWEREFLDSIHRFDLLSEKQRLVIARILRKLCARHVI